MSSLPKLRADARLNRDRLRDVARAALTADPNASLNAIAKAAGVGAGTLYRHFPDRGTLLLELYRQDVQVILDLAPTLLAEHPPGVALRLWFDRLAAYGTAKQSVGDALHAAMTDRFRGETHRPMADAANLLLKAAAEAGEVRADVTADDLFMLTSFLWRTLPGEGQEKRTLRRLDVIFAGLKPAT